MYSASFKKAVEPLLIHEGGWANDEADRGGATNWGISLRFLKARGYDIDEDGDLDWHDIANMSKEQAIEIYYKDFWRPFYDLMPYQVAAKVFNIAVHGGHSRAHKILQQALNSISTTIDLQVNGVIGPKSMTAIEAIDSGYYDTLLDAICWEQLEFYQAIVIRQWHKICDIGGLAKHVDQMKFLKGWQNRARWKP